MNRSRILLLVLLSGSLLFATSCKKEKIENHNTLDEMYKIYKDGEIYECQYNGELVYSAGLNAFDAGSVVYDRDGNEIGVCNYAWGQPDEICEELEDCETVYRVENNIWGQPAVDKYGLGN